MALCPFADTMLISANIGGTMNGIRGFAPHTQVGDGSLYAMFNNPTRKASTHFWVGKLGRLEQYVDTSRVAWAHGPGNPYFWSAEFEGMDDEPYTSIQIDTGGRLIAWLHDLIPFPLVINRDGVTGKGITPHRDLMSTSCPGDTRLAQYPELVLAALRHLDGNPGVDMPLDANDLNQIKALITQNVGGAVWASPLPNKLNSTILSAGELLAYAHAEASTSHIDTQALAQEIANNLPAGHGLDTATLEGAVIAALRKGTG